jgi:hypothetical protein
MLRHTRYAFFLLILLAACKGGTDAPDVSDIKARLSVRRYDQDLFAVDTNHIAEGLTRLKQKYPDFQDFYLDTLLGIPVNGQYDESSPAIREGVHALLTHHDYRGVFDSVKAHFPDTREVEDRLLKGYRYYRHYFPTAPEEKKVVFFSANLNRYAAITYGDMLGVGLDMYLGPQYPFYRAVEVPQYMTRRLTPQYIPVDAFISIHRDQHPFEAEDRSLLDMMIQKGQEQYFLEKVLPFEPDSVRFGLSSAHLQWCKDNEAQVFNYFASNKLLYETSTLKVLRYVNDGPRHASMPPESPGNVGTYVGYRIFKAWMEKHSDMPLDKAMARMEAQKVLQESHYKP